MKILLSSLLALLIAGPLQADDDVSQEEIRSLKESGIILPLKDILTTATQIKPGRVMEVELENKRGTYIYEIEIVDSDGVVWELKINAQDATLISQEQDD